PGPARTPRTHVRGLIEAIRGRSGAARPARLRGLTSAASLKRPDGIPLGHRGLETPRTHVRGLIEASSTASATSSGVATPRTHVRGLIEADARSSRRGRRRCRLRGLTSAASLKRVTRPLANEDLAVTPRTHVRGLIEAVWAPVPPRAARRLPGLTSAASLKLHAAEQVVLDERRLRGLTSAASLKPGDAIAPASSRIATPRTHVRGLIEASAPCGMSGGGARTPRTHVRGLIEAPTAPVCLPPARETPRPHVRGLIEAPSTPARARSGVDSADSRPRPH